MKYYFGFLKSIFYKFVKNLLAIRVREVIIWTYFSTSTQSLTPLQSFTKLSRFVLYWVCVPFKCDIFMNTSTTSHYRDPGWTGLKVYVNRIARSEYWELRQQIIYTLVMLFIIFPFLYKVKFKKKLKRLNWNYFVSFSTLQTQWWQLNKQRITFY